MLYSEWLHENLSYVHLYEVNEIFVSILLKIGRVKHQDSAVLRTQPQANEVVAAYNLTLGSDQQG